MKTPALAACVTLMVVALTTGSRAQGTQAQQSACTPDVLRLCSAYIPDADRIAACLRSQPHKLNTACRAAVGPVVGARSTRDRS